MADSDSTSWFLPLPVQIQGLFGQGQLLFAITCLNARLIRTGRAWFCQYLSESARVLKKSPIHIFELDSFIYLNEIFTV